MSLLFGGEGGAMCLTDELRKLQELRDAGTLSNAEFRQAKRALLKNPPARYSPPAAPLSDPFVDALKAWVQFRVVMGAIGLIAGAILFFKYFVPFWNGIVGTVGP